MQKPLSTVDKIIVTDFVIVPGAHRARGSHTFPGEEYKSFASRWSSPRAVVYCAVTSTFGEP